MKYTISVSSIYEFGKRKDAQGNPHQEDNIYPPQDALTTDDRLFIVCDGMGGHEAGEVASDAVCRTMSGYILAHSRPDGLFTDDILVAAISEAYDELNRLDTSTTSKKMGTTMTLLKLHSGGATIAHIGDSRVYHVRPGKDMDHTRIMHVTQDHSLVNELVRIGEITPEEALHHPRKNVITRAMQPGENRCRADIYHTTDIRPGDYFLLCTDGILENIGDEQILFHFAESSGSQDDITRKLTLATDDNSDNHSAIIVHILDVEGKPEPMSAPVPRPAAAAHKPTAAPAKSQSRSMAQQTAKPSAEAQIVDGGSKTSTLKKYLPVIAIVLSICAIALIFTTRRSSTTIDKTITVIDTIPAPDQEPKVKSIIDGEETNQDVSTGDADDGNADGGNVSTGDADSKTGDANGAVSEETKTPEGNKAAEVGEKIATNPPAPANTPSAAETPASPETPASTETPTPETIGAAI